MRLKDNQYQLVNGIPFPKTYNSVFLRCLEKSEAEKVLSEMKNGSASAHYGVDTTTHKILHAGYC